MHKRIIGLMISLSLMVIMMAPSTVGALGLVTKPIVISNALRGGQFQEMLNIVNTQSSDITVAFGAEGQISHWASFYQPNDLKNAITQINMAADTKADIVIIFAVPKDTPNGTYTGTVGVTQTAQQSSLEGKSVNVAHKVERKVTITVSDKEVVDVQASVIPEKYDLARGESLKIRVLYDNRGNISITPQVELKIKKDGQTVYSAIFPYPEAQEPVRPSSQMEIPAIVVPTAGFTDAKYQAELVITQSGQKVLEKSFTFSYGIYNPASALAATAKNFFGGNYIVNWLLVGLALAAVAGIFVVRNLKGKKPSSML